MKKKVLLIGGFHKAISLSQSLMKKGYSVTVINSNYDDCMQLANVEDLNIIYGDGTKAYVLEEADASSFDIAIALTKKDENNLVIAELCKKKFNIQKTVCLVKDPLKTDFFYQMGVDSVVCAINTISSIIEQVAFVEKMNKVISVEEGKVQIVEIMIQEGMRVVGKKIWEIKLPTECIIGYILRGDQGIVPRGDTRILKDDKLIVITSANFQDQVVGELTAYEKDSK